MRSGFVRASELYDAKSRTPIAHPAHQATDADVRRALEDRVICTDGGQPSSDTEQSAYRLSENLILLGDTLNAAQYHANRYQKTGHEHNLENALEDLRDLRDFADEILEDYEDTGGDR
ncbi:hypothetical protein [Natrinema thermotolerans]